MTKIQSDSKYLLNEHPISVYPSIAAALGLNEAIVVQQVRYWMSINQQDPSKRLTHFRDGRWWTYNTLKDWQKAFRWQGISTTKRIFGNLKQQGVLLRAFYHADKRNRTAWYSIDFTRLDEIIKTTETAMPIPLSQNEPMHCSEMSQCVGSKRNNDLYTETTDRDYKQRLQESTNGSNEPTQSFSTHSQEKKRTQNQDNDTHDSTLKPNSANAEYNKSAINTSEAAKRTAMLLKSITFDDLLERGKSATTTPTAVQSNPPSTCLAIPLTGTPPSSAPPSPAAPPLKPRNLDQGTVDSKTLAPEQLLPKQFPLDKEGVIVLPARQHYLASTMAFRRMQYLLAFDVLGFAQPSLDEDGEVEVKNGQIIVENLKGLGDDAVGVENYILGDRLSLNSLRTQAIHYGKITLQSYNDVLQALFDDSVEWLALQGDQAISQLQQVSLYHLFIDDSERFLGML